MGSYERINLEPVVGRQTQGVVANLVPQRLGESGIVKELTSSASQRGRHRAAVADVRQRAVEDDAVKAGKGSGDVVGIAFGDLDHGSLLMPESLAKTRTAA